MTDSNEPIESGDDAMDARLRAAGGVLRESFAGDGAQADLGSLASNTRQAHGAATADSEVSVVSIAEARRRSRRAGRRGAAAAALVTAIAASSLTYSMTNHRSVEIASAPELNGEMANYLAELPDQPVDPRTVKLSPSIARFESCDSLLDRLRRVGAQHVGSVGFGVNYGRYPLALSERVAGGDTVTTALALTGGGETLGTNVQVAGVDEPDVVKAVGALVYSLRSNRLRITDVATRSVVSVTDLDQGDGKNRNAYAASLLVSGNFVVVFGTESISSEPIKGDPSATVSSTEYLTITQIDVSNPAAPVVGTRSRIEGRLVAARLVGDQVRMVTGSSMADIGFLLPTSPTSVPTALEANRGMVANSAITDWIPEWDSGSKATPLVDCAQVYLPETFSGVSMTTMTNFTVDGSFAPSATAVLAPSEVVYATAEKVVVSSTIWVDPADRDDTFEDWTTAIHQFDTTSATPSYVGSGSVLGSVGQQFNFGEVGSELAVVSSSGTPWAGSPASEVTLTVLNVEGESLVAASALKVLGADSSAVSGVRFPPTRAIVSSGSGGQLAVIDLSDPANPRRGASLAVNSTAGYIHPLTPERLIVVGVRSFPSEAQNSFVSTAFHAELIDTTNPDAPITTGVWDRPYSSSNGSFGHHAFLQWASANLMAFPVALTGKTPGELAPPPEAAFVSTEDGLAERGSVRPQRVEVEPPCPTQDAQNFRSQLGPLADITTVLSCESPRQPDFPGYWCDRPYLGPDQSPKPSGTEESGVFLCRRNLQADVVRVLVVSGAPWLYTSESLESLDPATLASTGAIPIG